MRESFIYRVLFSYKSSYLQPRASQRSVCDGIFVKLQKNVNQAPVYEIEFEFSLLRTLNILAIYVCTYVILLIICYIALLTCRTIQSLMINAPTVNPIHIPTMYSSMYHLQLSSHTIIVSHGTTTL